MPRRYKSATLLVVALAGSALASDLAVLRNGFSIRHERRQVLGSVTRLYTGTDNSSYVDVGSEQIERFEKDLTPAAVPLSRRPGKPDLNEAVSRASEKHSLDADLINSVIGAESGFNPRAVSPKGAQGLMQLMPKTASELGVANAFDPQSNVDGGTRYLRWLLERYNYDLVKALAAYNAGPHRVERYRGVPPYYETRAYVARIIREYNRRKLAEQKAARERAQSAKSRTRQVVRSVPFASADPAVAQAGTR